MVISRLTEETDSGAGGSANDEVATSPGNVRNHVRGISLRLLVALLTQLLAFGLGPYGCTLFPPQWWNCFSVAGVFWLPFWSLLLPTLHGRWRPQLLVLVAAALSLVLLPMHAYRAPQVSAWTLAQVIGFVVANAAALLAARFGRTHFRAGAIYLVLFVCLFKLEVESFAYVKHHWAAPPATSCCGEGDEILP